MRHPHRSAIILLVFLLPVTLSWSQSFFTGDQRPRFNRLSRIDGLPNNSVSSIFQDRRGLMWFGTQGGLVRYDGHAFHTYYSEPFAERSLPHDLVQTTYYDRESDEIWVGTYAGLARYDAATGGFVTFGHGPDRSDSLSDNVVIAISRGPDGHLWVGTQNGLNRMNADGSFSLIPTRHPVIRDLFLDSRGDLWVASLAGLSRWDPEQERLIAMDGLDSPYVMAIDEIEPGVLLLGTWEADGNPGGVVAFREGDGELWRRRFSTNSIYSVLAASDGTIWAGSWGGGLFAIDRNGTIHEFTPDTERNLADPVIYSLYEDESGLVWVGTNGGGIHLLSPRQRNYRLYFHDPDRPESLPQGRVTAILRDGGGTLWIGTYGGGLARRDPDDTGWRIFRAARRPGGSASDGLANDIINALFEDRDGSIWIATNGGLQRLRPGSTSFESWQDVFPGNPYVGEIVYAVTRDSRGRYWIGTYRSGVTRFDPETGDLETFRADPDDAGIANDLIYGIREDRSGTVWIATNGGLTRYSPETDSFTSYRYDPENPDGLSSNTVRGILEDSRGRLWFATLGGGINRYLRESDTFSHITVDDGLASNRIVSLLEGHDGKIWAGTQHGLASFDPVSSRIQIIDEQDGLFGSEFNAGAFRDTGGELLFGGAHGVTRIDSSIDNRNTHRPTVQIIDVRVFQESIDPGRLSFDDATVELAARDTFVSFEFAAMDYEAVDANVYRYRLRGFEEEWVDSGTRNYASYTNLPPGTYELQVLAANADGVWSQSPATLNLTVVAPWYLRWWAIGFYAAGVALLVYTMIRAREARVLADKNAQLEHAVSQLARANEELERLSIRDSLTGSFNRRYFDTMLQEEWNRARRTGTPLGLLMIDVDHFKAFNDTHGHVVGDTALEAVARVMAEQLNRSTDFVARYGGEEFAAVLYETDVEGAVAVGERIRRAVESAELGNGVPGVTVSVGVGSVIPGAADPTTLVLTADRALYAAKRRGRNRVERTGDDSEVTVN